MCLMNQASHGHVSSSLAFVSILQSAICNPEVDVHNYDVATSTIALILRIHGELNHERPHMLDSRPTQATRVGMPQRFPRLTCRPARQDQPITGNRTIIETAEGGQALRLGNIQNNKVKRTEAVQTAGFFICIELDTYYVCIWILSVRR